ncbi:hypothetical protein CPC08DRAFT_713566, partial [Agrocybe pediades]
MIPEERWTGEKQDVGHIRVWGCVAYVHIPGSNPGNRTDREIKKCSVRGRPWPPDTNGGRPL